MGMVRDDDGFPGFWGYVFITVFSTLLLMIVWAIIRHGAFREVFTSWNSWVLAIVVSLSASIGFALQNRFGGKHNSSR